MVRSSFRSLLIVALLFLSAAASPPPEEAANRHAKELCGRGDWKAAYEFITSALQRFPTSDSDSVWNLRLLLSQTLLSQNKTPEAVQLLATPLPPRLAKTEIGVRWTMNTAVAAYRQGNYDQADSIFEGAEDLARKSQPRLLGSVLLYRANQKAVQKQTDIGLRYARRAVVEGRRFGDVRVEMTALATVGWLLTQEGHYAAAINAEKKAITFARALGDNSLLQKIEGNLGWAYTAIGEYDLAYEIFTRDLALSRKLGAERDSIPWMIQFADAAQRRGDHSTALGMYRDGVALARRSQHPDLAEYLTNFGLAQLETGDIGGARASTREALAVRGENEEQALRATLLEARIDAATGALDDAIAKCRRIIDTKLSYSLRWEAQGRLAQFYVIAKRPDAAEKEFIRAVDTAAEARKSIETEELRLPFGAVVREVYDAYVDFMVSNRPPEESLLAAERGRAQTLEEALQGSYRRRTVDFQRIARDRNSVVLAYWLASPRSFVWVVTGSSVEVIVLPPAHVIEQRIEAYSRQLATLNTSEAMLQKGGADLFAMLVGPVVSNIGEPSRVIIVPDGGLNAFNMETLVVPKKTPLRYWIEDVTITSTASLELLDRALPARAPSSMLLVGDPPSPDPEFPRLKNGAGEIRFVAAHFPRHTILDGARATPTAYKEAGAERFGYIHFVAHGVATRQVPLDSAVVLGRDTDDFKLYARDIIKLPLRARLVTISSCHGAGTRSYTGEGLVGLAWAFLHAGAQQVIAALWEVDEATTPQLMDDLYSGIQQGRDPASALRAAKLRLVHSPSLHRRPYYWAPFVLYSGS